MSKTEEVANLVCGCRFKIITVPARLKHGEVEGSRDEEDGEAQSGAEDGVGGEGG
eukprot:CAMPEP_0174755462 /NCGR_PEP_ID=MMETSP1094-20130205/106258_1 /TAXON_ID=156173 /ORGANISM="Chrysochromulina brevifilum, Strain UTEX LB 985" /LENGTH=54 /DNA_ID=CAMNT_0015961351 /DNA_START=1005 /DNA_END=1172 /DNA_ORIENTATION=+